MAVDINVVVLVGRLTRDCELKTTPQGTSVCRFSIAVNRRKRTGDRWEDEVSYFDIVLWGKSGETLRSYLQRGRQVSIEGELRQNRWKDPNGQSQSRVEVLANNVQLLGGGQTSVDGIQPQGGKMSSGSMPQGQSNDFGPESAFDDSDFPF